MKNIKALLLFAIISLSLNFVFAASPLSGTKFYSVYLSQDIVQLAESQGFLDGRIAVYLIDENNDIGVKVAIINALNWSEKENVSVDTYKMFMGRKYGKNYNKLDFSEMSGDELLCLGYMVLLDQKRTLAEAMPILEEAQLKNKNSFTSNIIYAMALAQSALNASDECQAWRVCNDTRINGSLVQDMDVSASAILFEAVDTYKEACD
ncbi:MAG: hypothetical protein R2764_20365 [Bacteroidales bacterium]